jgi:hypothetical protein
MEAHTPTRSFNFPGEDGREEGKRAACMGIKK